MLSLSCFWADLYSCTCTFYQKALLLPYLIDDVDGSDGAIVVEPCVKRDWAYFDLNVSRYGDCGSFLVKILSKLSLIKALGVFVLAVPTFVVGVKDG